MKPSVIVYFVYLNFFVFCTCQNPTKKEDIQSQKVLTAYDSITNYFSNRQKKEFKSIYKKLFVISENGCSGCNKRFFELTKHFINDSTCCFLITAQGMYLDITKLGKSKHVYFDQSILETDYSFFHHSKFISINHQNVDTTLVLDARYLEDQLQFIRTFDSTKIR